ncbi:MAG: Uma2 family endonuclease [Spirochaetota bacterium]
MQTALPISQPIFLRMPHSYPLDGLQLVKLQQDNPDVVLKLAQQNSLEILEHRFSFYEQGNFPLKLSGLTHPIFSEIHALNQELHLEFDDREEVRIQMGVIRLISKLTAKLITSFMNWATKHKLGEVYGENGEYHLQHPEKKEQHLRKIPDVSYISYSTASEEEQDSWESFLPIPPNMALEIVSAKYSLATELKKMQNVWMPVGVGVGIVVCPFSEKIYIFENGKQGYRQQSIYQDFTHPQLPKYKDNFGKYLKKKK